MKPAAAERMLAEEMAYLSMVPSVPGEVAEAWRRVQATYCNGLFHYASFTLAADQSFRVTEIALKRRFMEFYSCEIPLVQGSATTLVKATSFDDVDKRIRAGSRSQSRPTELIDYGPFNGSFSALMRWARHVGLLDGQSARIKEQWYLRSRNKQTHSDQLGLMMPPEASRQLQFVCEFVNRLWGHPTPDGRHYPAPVTRATFLYGRAIAGPMESTTWHIDGVLAGVPEATLKDAGWQYWVLRTEPNEELRWWSLDFEGTAYPIDVLAGPGQRDDILNVIRTGGPWADDTVPFLDRTFFLRWTDGSLEPARNAGQFVHCADVKGDRWYAVVADHPGLARHHVNGVISREHPATGPCPVCGVIGVLNRSRRQTALRLARDVYGARVPEEVQA